MTTIMRMTAVESGPTIRSISLNCDPRKYPAIAKAELQTAVPAADQRKNRAIPIFRGPAGMEIIVLTLGSMRATKTIAERSEEHTSELQSLMRISYAVFCLKKKKTTQINKKN